MRPHLHLLGILQLVWGAIGLVLGVSMLLLALGALAIGVSAPAQRVAAGVTAGALSARLHVRERCGALRGLPFDSLVKLFKPGELRTGAGLRGIRCRRCTITASVPLSR